MTDTEKKPAIDLETLKLMKEIIVPTPPAGATPVVPAYVHRRSDDQDTFATFTNGLRQNWVFVMAIFAVGFWIITNTLENQTVDGAQETAIQANAQAIINLNKSFEAKNEEVDKRFDTFLSANSEIIRRLDGLAKDIEIIKAR